MPAFLSATQGDDRLGALALVSLVPLFFASTRLSAPCAAALGAVVGTLYGTFVGAWIPDALRELGSDPVASWTGTVVTAAWAKAVLFAGMAWTASMLRSRPVLAQVGGIALAAALLEGWVERGRLGVPVALIGHSQLDTSGVAQLAIVGGVPLVSAWIVAINVAIALAISRVAGAWQLAIAGVASWVMAAWVGLPLAEVVRPTFDASPATSLVLVQPDIRHRDRWIPELQAAHLEQTTAYTAEALSSVVDRPDLVVWPENLLARPIDGPIALTAALHDAVDSLEVPVLVGVSRSPVAGAPGQYRSAVLWVEPGRDEVIVFEKERAIPVLESATPMPGERVIERFFGRAAEWPKVQEVPGGGPLHGRFTVTPVLCYEVLFPDLVANRRSEDSVAILNLADDSWVEGDAATRLLARIARYRAIEQRLTLIRVAHGGLSLVVGPFGDVLEELPLDTWASAVVDVHAMPPPTLVEKVSLSALPIATGFAVWWISGWVDRRSGTIRGRDRAERDG